LLFRDCVSLPLCDLIKLFLLSPSASAVGQEIFFYRREGPFLFFFQLACSRRAAGLMATNSPPPVAVMPALLGARLGLNLGFALPVPRQDPLFFFTGIPFLVSPPHAAPF